MDGNPYSEYNYVLNVNGKSERHYLDACTAETVPGCKQSISKSSTSSKEANFMTHVLEKKSIDFITQNATSKTPFFLYLATYAPHGPATPSPKYEALLRDPQWLADHPMPKTAAYNEADISDKPTWLQGAKVLTKAQTANNELQYHKRLISMYAVEDMIDRLVATLGETGQLENTYIVFTSDNGFHLGEHRLFPGKLTAFDTDLRVPLIVRGPLVAPGSVKTEITANVDLAPTLAALAGITPTATVDGRSFAPYLLGSSAPAWRHAVLIEHANPSDFLDVPAGTLEPRDDGETGPTNNGGELVTKYVGVRTPQYTYVQYAKNAEQELYDNLADPHQLTNIAKTASPALLGILKKWATDLSTCSGETCRTIEAEKRI